MNIAFLPILFSLLSLSIPAFFCFPAYQLNGNLTGSNMSSSATPNVTQLLVAWGDGDQVARDELVPLVYDEWHKTDSSYDIVRSDPRFVSLLHRAGFTP